MKSRTIFISLAILFGLAIGFWLYGVGRTLRETVSFNTTASLSGLLLSVVLPLVAALPLLVVKSLWSRAKTWPVSRLFIVFTLSLVVGSVASELWILRDEARFSAEADNKAAIYSRPRVWPNQGCSLVFVPGKGIHSTD